MSSNSHEGRTFENYSPLSAGGMAMGKPSIILDISKASANKLKCANIHTRKGIELFARKRYEKTNQRALKRGETATMIRIWAADFSWKR